MLHPLELTVTKPSINNLFIIPSGPCRLGWSLIVALVGILLGYLVAILSCVLAAKTPLARHEKSNQVIEVQPAPRRGGQMMTSRA